jgi:hypothetical protein
MVQELVAVFTESAQTFEQDQIFVQCLSAYSAASGLMSTNPQWIVV